MKTSARIGVLTLAVFVFMGAVAPNAFAIFRRNNKRNPQGSSGKEFKITSHESAGSKAKRTGLGIGAGTGMAVLGAVIGVKASLAFSAVVGGLWGVAQVGMGNTPDEWWLVNGIAEPVFKSFEYQVPEIIRAGAAGFVSTVVSIGAIGAGVGAAIGGAIGAQKR